MATMAVELKQEKLFLVKKSHGSWDVTLPVFGVCYGKDTIDFRSGFMVMVGGNKTRHKRKC